MDCSLKPETLNAFFIQAEKVCQENTLPFFRTNMTVENKLETGFDPVTHADRQTETALRNLIIAHFPDHGIIGEEHGTHQPQAQYCWIIDPIDGTRAFISGLPSWGCLIGLTKNGKPISGMMHQPYTAETWYTFNDKSYFRRNGISEPIFTSKTTDLSNATLMSTTPEMFSKAQFLKFNAVSKKVLTTRYGFDCYGYAMVASGQIELVIECSLQSYDIAPLIPIIEQAGGIVTTWEGDDPSKGGNIIAAANQEIHQQAITILKGS